MAVNARQEVHRTAIRRGIPKATPGAGREKIQGMGQEKKNGNGHAAAPCTQEEALKSQPHSVEKAGRP